MILSDYHIHSNYSIDSDEPMEESVCVAIKKGLKEMIFTDHLETLNRNEPIREVIDYKEYTEEIDRLQQKYAGQIKIKLGAEINLEAELCDQYNACIREFDFDLIIGSIHAVDFVDVGTRAYYRDLTVDEYHEKYYKDMLRIVQHDFEYSVLGHLDYIVRYGGYRNNVVDLKKQRQYIEPIMRKVIEKGRGIELNTSGLRYNLKDVHPSREIISLYRELGGEIITIGSDSHVASTVGQDFDLAEKLLMDIGFKYYTVYDKMQPSFLKLG